MHWQTYTLLFSKPLESCDLPDNVQKRLTVSWRRNQKTAQPRLHRKACVYTSPWLSTLCSFPYPVGCHDLLKRSETSPVCISTGTHASRWSCLVWYEDCRRLCIKSNICRCHIDESIKSWSCWNWVCNDIKPRSCTGALITYAQRMLRVVFPSFHTFVLPPFLKVMSFCPARGGRVNGKQPSIVPALAKSDGPPQCWVFDCI